MQVPDIHFPSPAAPQQPNGDSPIETNSPLNFTTPIAPMDVESPQDASEVAPEIRLAKVEAECDRLRRQLAKARQTKQEVSNFLQLYNEKVAELDRTKTEFQAMIVASQETFQRDLDNAQQLLKETEKARKSADQHISEQSVLVSQLQSQLTSARHQLQSSGDSQDLKKDFQKLRLEVESKERALAKKDEKIAMQQLEIANLAQRVKSLEKALKQGGIPSTPTSHRATASVPASLATTPSTSTAPSPFYEASTALSPEIPPKKRPTRSRAKRASAQSKRSGTSSEEDEEMADTFMQTFGKDLAMSSSENDDPDFVLPISTASPSPVEHEPRPTRPQRTKSTKVTSSVDMDVDEDEKLRVILNPPTPTKSAIPKPASEPITIIPLSSSTSLMPPPASATPLRRAKTNLSRSSSSAASTASAASTPLASPSTKTNASLPSAESMVIDIPARRIVFQPTYRLQPVTLSWAPIVKISAISSAICELLSSSPRGTPNSAQVSTLASKICCAKISNVVQATIEAITHATAPLVHSWDEGAMSEQEMMEIVADGPVWEETLVALILSFAHGSMVKSSSSVQIVERMLLSIHRSIFGDKVSREPELPDFQATFLVRLFTRLCRELGFVQRARDLLFDILREREEICILQLIGSIASWPLIVDSHLSTDNTPSDASISTSATHYKSFVSCTIECIVSAALSASDDESALTGLQRACLKRVAGWKFAPELLERQSSGNMDEPDRSRLQCWTDFVIAFFRSCVDSARSEVQPKTIHRLYSTGTDLLRSMELLATQMGWNKTFQNILHPIVAPRLSDFITLFPTRKADIGAVVAVRLLIKACGVLSRVGLDSGGNITASISLIQQFLSSGVGIDMIVQVEAVLALIGLATSEISLNLGKIWLSSLPPSQRRCVPDHVQNLLK